MKSRRHRGFGLALATGSAFVVTVAGAAEFPTKPIRLVIPFAAGGSNDVTARALQKRAMAPWAPASAAPE